MTPDQAARRLEQAAGGLAKAAERAAEQIARLAYQRAIWWSSGPLSAAQLRRMGRPYARRQPGNVDPGGINVQTGRLLAGWVVAPVTDAPGGGRRVVLYNAAPEARFMYDTGDPPAYPDRGTRLMVGRPLPERVLADIAPRAEAIIERELDRI